MDVVADEKKIDDELEAKAEDPKAEVEKEEEEISEADADAEDKEAEDEVVVSIGEDTPPQEEPNAAPEWVRQLRKDNREMKKKLKVLERQKVEAVEKPLAVGEKPTLKGHDYDAANFEKDLEAWHLRKQAHDANEARATQSKEKEAADWQVTLDGYEKKKDSLKVSDFEDAEAVALDVLSVTEQGMILQGAENPAVVMYALGKNPKQLKELTEIKDPVKFAFAVAKLEVTMKVTNRKASTQPEQKVSGTARVSGSVDSKLENLRKNAEKTGDYSEVRKYKKNLKAKQ